MRIVKLCFHPSPHTPTQIQHIKEVVLGFKVFVGEGFPEFEHGEAAIINGFVAYDDKSGYFFVAGKKDEFCLG